MMETRIREIDSEIAKLKNELNCVKGQETEVYSRIVGYYRSVKNWNLGKKEEYKDRIAFTNIETKKVILEDESSLDAASVEEISPVTDKVVVSCNSIAGYNYFYRSSCPNCPAMKEVLDHLPLDGEHLNVDMERGMEAASQNMVFSAPTVIFQDADGKELYRTCHPSDVEDLFALESVTA